MHPLVISRVSERLGLQLRTCGEDLSLQEKVEWTRLPQVPDPVMGRDGASQASAGGDFCFMSLCLLGIAGGLVLSLGHSGPLQGSHRQPQRSLLRLPRWGYPMRRGPCSQAVALQRLLLKAKGMRFPAGLGRRVFKPKNRAWCVQAGKPPSSYISVMQGAASEMMTSSRTRYLGLHLSCLALVGEMARCKRQDVRLTAKGQPQSAPGPASCPG